MIEFVLAVSMMYVGNEGQIKSLPFSGTYPTHSSCVQALTNKIQLYKEIFNTVLTPVGTDVCVQRDAAVLKPSEAGCSAAAAAAASTFDNELKKPKLSSRKIQEAKKVVEADTYKACMQRTGIFAN